jgi:hypothetical protein
MTFRKKAKTRFKSFLRRLGLLCKKPTTPSKRIRISKTLWPDGTVTDHERLDKQPLFEGNTFETELHLWNELHKDVKKKKSKSTPKK